MDTILQITAVAILGAATILALWFYSRLKKGKTIPKPKDHGNAWSNNAIRKHGKEGKGIR